MDYNDSQITVEKAIENNELPRFIYKYFTNEKNRLQDTLNNSTIWFSKPIDFNDPFDCRLIVDTDNTSSEITEYANNLCKGKNLTDDQIIRVKQNLLNNDYRFKSANESVQNAVSISGVSCFSKINDSILMWSHYSNSHKGYCLKFDLLKDPDFFTIPVIVDYKTKYPHFNYIKNRNDLFLFVFGNKFIDWCYEKEIRIVRQEQGNVKINPESIVEINFGIDSDKSDIESIIDLCKSNNYNHIGFQKAKRMDLDFKIGFDKL